MLVCVYTYTLAKLTFLDFFPQRTWKILKNAQKRQKKTSTLAHVYP